MATIVCTLADVPVRRRAEPAGESADRRAFFPAVPRRLFSVRCFRVASCTNGYGGASEKIPPRQRQCFINARTGVPQYGQQHLAAQIRDVMEQGAHFRGAAGRLLCPRGGGHSSQGECCCKNPPPGAMGNRETRSGEFCRGMTLFMSYFSRSTRTVYGYRWFCCFWEKWGNNARWHRSGG